MEGIVSDRVPILSVTIHDCEVQTFRSGGKGGQNQNKVNSGVRVIHHPSGARGESRESRDQPENKRRAFLRMVETPQFKSWLAIATGRIKSDDQLLKEIDEELSDPNNLRVEYRENGKWTEVDPQRGP
jgi:protein subunit release factor B